MSDTTRESFTSQAGSTLKPDQQKTSTEQAGNKMRGKADNVASAVQPDSQKSTTQQASDTAGDTLKGVSDSSKSMMDQAKKTVGLGDK